jgi:hypothetical protein
MLLIFMGFVVGLVGGWMNPAETSVPRASAAAVDIARASTFRTEPLSTMTVLISEPAQSRETISGPPGSGHAARKRRQLKAKLASTPVRAAVLRNHAELDDDDDDDEY